MRKDPEQINAIISGQITEQTEILRRLEHEQQFHHSKKQALKHLLLCEHVSEVVTPERSRCKKCGYTWFN